MKRTKRLLSFFLAGMTALSLAVPVQAANFKDTKGHWAESVINSAVERGYTKGYDDNTFRPGNAITRAEFCKMLNGALGLTSTAAINFSDVPNSKWYYKDVQKAVSAGYISGYEDGTFLGDSKITRQEAALVIARLIADPADLKDLSSLKDHSTIASWALTGVKNVYAKGYMKGDDLGKFNPKGSLTRAEAVKIIESLLTGEAIVRSNITVSESGLSYSNKVFTGNVIISADLGEGSVTFKNCRILGTLLVNGGGTAGIRLSNTGVANLTVDSKLTTGVAAVGSSTVYNTYLSSAASLTESALTGLGKGFVDVTVGGAGLTSTTLSGDYDSVTVGASTVLNVSSGNIKAMTVASNAKDSRITLAKGVSVDRATVNADCAFLGKGTIAKADCKTNGVTFETTPGSSTGTPSTPDPSDKLVITTIPKDDAVRIPIDVDLTLTFSETFKKADGGALTTSYVREKVILREGGLSGEIVTVNPSISQNGLILTLAPDADLEPDQKYTLTIGKDAFKGASGVMNDGMTVVFETDGEDSAADPDNEDVDKDMVIEFYPGDGTEVIPVQTELTLTFDEKLFTDEVGTVNASYIEKNVQLRKGTKSGTKVAFSASVNTAKKVITLMPDKMLDTETEYYVVLPEGVFMTESGLNPAKSWSFTTADSEYVVPMAYPASGTYEIGTDPTFTFVFEYPVYNDEGEKLTSSYMENYVFTLREGSAKGDEISCTAERASDGVTLSLTPDKKLDKNEVYYLTIAADSLLDENFDEVPKLTYVYHTGAAEDEDEEETVAPKPSNKPEAGDLAPYETYPAHGQTKVGKNSKIMLFFDDAMKQASGSKDITAAYVESDMIEIRRGSKSGTKVAFTAGVSTDKTIITLSPDKAMTDSYTYYITIKEGSFKIADGTLNDKYVMSFTVGSSGSNSSSDGELELTVDADINEAELTVEYDFRDLDWSGEEEEPTLEITYAKENGTYKTLIDLYAPGDDYGTETFSLKKLEADTEYTVRVKIEYGDGEEILVSETFTTGEEEEEAGASTLDSIRVQNATGGYFKASFKKVKTGKYKATVSGVVTPISRKVKIICDATDPDAWIEIDGDYVDSGEAYSVPVTRGDDQVTVDIVVEGDEDTTTYELVLDLNW